MKLYLIKKLSQLMDWDDILFGWHDVTLVDLSDIPVGYTINYLDFTRELIKVVKNKMFAKK